MGIQTMATQGGGGGQRSQNNNLVRQNSLFSLTLNEVENHLGEPLHSMNLEELIKGLDTNQEVDGPTNQYNASSSGLQRQGSITMPRSLRDKTVDEVWREIQQGNAVNKEGEDRAFGQMTLEDFLAKAGVVGEDTGVNLNVNVNEMIGEGTQYGQQHWLNPYQAVPPQMNFGSMYPEGQMGMMSPMVGAMSDAHTAGRKRGALSDLGDRSVDRRQKRMIKNRESAARSRARKQAYTNELENKVSFLEEENARLKKQLELDRILYAPQPEPKKYQLRPTCSASF